MKNFIKIFLGSLLIISLYSCEKDVFIEYEEEVVIDRGRGFIDSNPQGASIFLGGKNTGYLTPSTLYWVKEGAQSITLKKEKYIDTTFTVYFSEIYPPKIYIDFLLNSKNYGKIYCTSPPISAEVILDDSLTNKKTPALLSQLTPGIHKVKLKYAGHRDDSTNVLVQNSQISNVNLTLEDTTKWVSYLTTNSDISSNYLKNITAGKRGEIWIGSSISLQMFDGKKWNTYTPSNSILKSGVINVLKMDEQDRLWIGTELGLYTYKDNSLIDYSNLLPAEGVTAIKINKDVIWIGTRKGLLKISSSGNQIFTTNNSGLKDDYITAIEVDDLGKIWIGGLFNGISIYDGTNWEYFNSSNITVRYLPNYVQTIFKTFGGKMLVALTDAERNTGYLLRYDEGKWIDLRPYVQSRVYEISRNGNEIIFATQGGLFIYKNDYYYKYQFGNTKVNLIKSLSTTFDTEGNIWVGTFDSGIAKFKKGNF